jgi:hypothetical protein
VRARGEPRGWQPSPSPLRPNCRSSHLPDSKFFHGDSDEEGPDKTLDTNITTYADRRPYEYAALSNAEIRLMQVSSGRHGEPIHCTLKVLNLEKIVTTVLEFQALSYAWGHDAQHETIFLSDARSSTMETSPDVLSDQATNSTSSRPFKVHKHLYNALSRIRREDKHTWIWVDALCINQKNDIEKSHQIPKMPDIYSNAMNVIVWLGEADGGQKWVADTTNTALQLIPKLLNLKILDSMLKQDTTDDSVLRSWMLFSEVLQLPWFTRRWVRCFISDLTRNVH